MIDGIITYYDTVLSGMPYFDQTYGLCELRPREANKLQPVYFNGTDHVTVKFNGLGTAYIRKVANVTMTQLPSMISCRSMYRYTVGLRVFALTKRSTFPTDNAYSADRLAATLIRQLTFRNRNDVLNQLNAQAVNSSATVYSTDSKQLITEELQGVSNIDFNTFRDIVCAVNLNVVVDTYNDCIIEPCEYIPRFCLQLESYVALP
jgi:hypothetical protein